MDISGFSNSCILNSVSNTDVKGGFPFPEVCYKGFCACKWYAKAKISVCYTLKHGDMSQWRHYGHMNTGTFAFMHSMHFQKSLPFTCICFI